VRFTVWGVDDGTSWVNHWWEFGPYDDAPLLFDRNWLPKPAYCQGVRPVFDLPQGACAVA
jgi:GH35 family endo-1,4-beta-xylanase